MIVEDDQVGAHLADPASPAPERNTVTFKEPHRTRASSRALADPNDDYNPGLGLDLARSTPARRGRGGSVGQGAGRGSRGATPKARKALGDLDDTPHTGSSNDPEHQRKVKLVTEQNPVDKPSPVAEFPMREWTITLFMIDDQGNEHPADCFNKVVYHLHPSFENPHQAFTKAPFACNNEGWGEFEMDIDCYYTEKTKLTLKHDLNFQENRYESVQNISFKNPSQALQEKLRELGPLPDDDARPKKKGVTSKKSGAQKYDFEKIAEALEKLEEDDLLKIIQMINDYKSPDTYIKSDVEVDTLLEAGEFSIDLYTMPDILTKMLWDHLLKKGLIG